MKGEPIHPPAAAYYAVAGIVGEFYLRTPPPRSGVRMTIVGDDKLATVWDFSEPQAASVQKHLRRRRRDVKVMQSVPYEEKASWST